VLELMEAFLKQEIVKEMERWTPTGGTPQGAVMTPPTQSQTLSLNGWSRTREVGITLDGMT
jgi:hypothetical protein